MGERQPLHMKEHLIEQIRQDLKDLKASIRLRAMDRISKKRGGSISLEIKDEDIIPILIEALSDRDRRVQRAAARGLQPWIQAQPGLLDKIWPHYTTDSFDGSYTHIGLYDLVYDRILIPRFQAVKGHASLLSDCSTDKYLKFEFYVPGQAPRRFLKHQDDGKCGHLLFHFILDWSYSRQCLIPAFDDRRMAVNLIEQKCYASTVVGFYRDSKLPYDAMIHHLVLVAGRRPKYELNVDFMPASSDRSREE